MNVLIVGAGGREHAITKAVAKSKQVTNVYVVPGNPGTATIATNLEINPMDNQAILDACMKYDVSLVIPGSEVYLENSITDFLTKHNIHVFGPTKQAAQIETSKEFAKDLMKKYQIPTADYAVFSDYQEALAYIQQKGAPIVLKYDGLAGGKGVVVALDFTTAESALKEMLLDQKYGTASVVIEEYLEGPEFSLMCFVDQDQVIPMPIAQDHKRLLDQDQGPNTGGMGIYSGVPIIPTEVIEDAYQNIMIKTIQALKQENIPYTGFLYGGLMYTKNGPKVIEFNARFGDPEAEVILPKLESDIVDIIINIKQNKTPSVKWNKDYYLGVVMASKGYPETYQKGYLIEGVEPISDYVIHMGTRHKVDGLYTNGGRVLLVLGKGSTLQKAQQMAYRHVSQIQCENLMYRSDIGYRSLKGL